VQAGIEPHLQPPRRRVIAIDCSDIITDFHCNLTIGREPASHKSIRCMIVNFSDRELR
jgi:hypothetical protein